MPKVRSCPYCDKSGVMFTYQLIGHVKRCSASATSQITRAPRTSPRGKN